MESSINENNSQNKNEIYKNQIKSILECLKSPMARPKALEAILGLCESEELTEIFISLELPKIMVRLLENEDIKEKDQVLQILINISGKESYLPHFLKINTIHRILNLIFKTIKHEFEEKDKEKNSKIENNIKNNNKNKIIFFFKEKWNLKIMLKSIKIKLKA